MSAGAEAAVVSSNREITASRVFDAPRELVWKAWTDPVHIAQWWGPNGFTNTIHEMDVRPGGVWRFVMHGPDGRDYQNKIVYVEVVRPERLAYDHVSGPVFRATASFVQEGARTRVTVRMVFETAALRDAVAREFGAVEGLAQTLARLEAYATGLADRDIVITRVFAAPRDLVFQAWTRPEHLTRWWAPKGCTTPFCTVDFRPGGRFHYCMRLPEGRDIWGLGVYREIAPPERIVYTDSFADAEGHPVPPAHYGMSPGHPAETLVTVTFTDEEGKTRLTLRHSIPESVTERDGTRQGWLEMLDRLAETLARA